MAEQSSASIVSMTDIRKDFPGVQALKGVSFNVNAGEVLAGAGIRCAPLAGFLADHELPRVGVRYRENGVAAGGN